MTADEPRKDLDLLIIGDCNPDVLVLGDDVTPAFGQQEKLVDAISLVIGGSAAITAVAAARLGLRVGLAAATEMNRARQILAQALGVTVRAAPGSAALTAQIEGDADRGTSEAVAWAMNQLARSGIKVASFALGQPSLDEVFLALTGHAAQDNRKAGEAA